MVLFCLKSYNIVAPYENLDDDYASKMGKSTVAFIPEVTISESEIAELEKPKFKEVKPKVSKVDKAVEVTSKTGKITEGGSKSADLGNKLDYIFGKGTGNKHNIQRSQSMQIELEKIGVYDDLSGRDYLTQHLNKVLNDSSNISSVEVRSYVAKEKLVTLRLSILPQLERVF